MSLYIPFFFSFFPFRKWLDDSWLSVDPATLDQILGDKFGLLGVDDDEAKADILPKLETFLNRSSDYEGITNTGRKKSRKMSHLIPPGPSRKTSTLSNSSDVSQLSNQIGFDPDSFASAMQGILGNCQSVSSRCLS